MIFKKDASLNAIVKHFVFTNKEKEALIIAIKESSEALENLLEKSKELGIEINA